MADENDVTRIFEGVEGISGKSMGYMEQQVGVTKKRAFSDDQQPICNKRRVIESMLTNFCVVLGQHATSLKMFFCECNRSLKVCRCCHLTCKKSCVRNPLVAHI